MLCVCPVGHYTGIEILFTAYCSTSDLPENELDNSSSYIKSPITLLISTPWGATLRGRSKHALACVKQGSPQGNIVKVS